MKALFNSDTVIFYVSIALLDLYVYHDINKPIPRRPLAPVRVNAPPINNTHPINNDDDNDNSWDWIMINVPRPAIGMLAAQLAAEKNVPESELGDIFEEMNDVATQRQQIAKERNVLEKDLDLLYIELGKKVK